MRREEELLNLRHRMVKAEMPTEDLDRVMSRANPDKHQVKLPFWGDAS